ncbi:hypothetical protein VK792_09935 [Mesobacterium sp. TK19101]|uniref:Uncharacterized protein n=1 Tax=Mesobacterium hydrothermale TaxID=3111907 RepID=A0ABU6HGL6_9RHOB|nr:hypothetical protein [Mesobacterium sp. TK19101]MEC3861603.1 hypothetical protein [Mesobacterium sp. TK19101]
MAQARVVRFYLDPPLKRSAERGQHNFLTLVAETLIEAGFRVAYHRDSAEEREKSRGRNGFALFHMAPPTTQRGVTIRRAYHYPFWAIEPQAERWHWHVARSRFNPETLDPALAKRFTEFWRKRLFAGWQARDDGFVYVPLQGRLADHRAFQTCSPIAMLNEVLARDPRPVVATLHPGETYSVAELSALQALVDAHPRLTLASGQMDRFLPACSCVVTQNSSAAFNGYFFEKPTVLFAQVDFHHIAGSVPRDGVDAAFAARKAPLPAYACYLWWYWQHMSINAGHPSAKVRIAQALRRAGWPM